jgi:glycosyltransferase involved in cell wall biosynthesis
MNRAIKMNQEKPKIIFVNQSSGPLFRELVESAAYSIGPALLLSSESYLPKRADIKMRKISAFDRNSWLSRIISWLMFFIGAGWHGMKSPRRSLLFIVTNPPIMPLLGWLLHLLRKQRYALLYYDIYPEVLIRFGGISADSLVARAWRALNQLAINNAGLVITISEPMAKTLSLYFSVSAFKEKLLVVPTWVDTEWIKPIPKEDNSFAHRQGCLGNLVVLYSGHVGAVHDLSMLPMVAVRLIQYPRIRFLIVSSSPRRIDLEVQCQDLKLDNVMFLPEQPEIDLPEVLAAGDIAIVSLAMGADGVSMPSKTYYMMAAGNALLGISSPKSELDRLIGEYQCGRNIVPDNVDDAVQTILYWYENDNALIQIKQRSRNAAQSYYDKKVIIPKLLSKLARL